MYSEDVCRRHGSALPRLPAPDQDQLSPVRGQRLPVSGGETSLASVLCCYIQDEIRGDEGLKKLGGHFWLVGGIKMQNIHPCYLCTRCNPTPRCAGGDKCNIVLIFTLHILNNSAAPSSVITIGSDTRLVCSSALAPRPTQLKTHHNHFISALIQHFHISRRATPEPGAWPRRQGGRPTTRTPPAKQEACPRPRRRPRPGPPSTPVPAPPPPTRWSTLSPWGEPATPPPP